jgi:hypothetical protein
MTKRMARISREEICRRRLRHAGRLARGLAKQTDAALLIGDDIHPEAFTWMIAVARDVMAALMAAEDLAREARWAEFAGTEEAGISRTRLWAVEAG